MLELAYNGVFIVEGIECFLSSLSQAQKWYLLTNSVRSILGSRPEIFQVSPIGAKIGKLAVVRSVSGAYEWFLSVWISTAFGGRIS